MLGAVRRGRLCVQLQPHNRGTRRMRFEIELQQLEQGRLVLQRQRWPDNLVLLATVKMKNHTQQRDRKILGLYPLQQRICQPNAS